MLTKAARSLGVPDGRQDPHDGELAPVPLPFRIPVRRRDVIAQLDLHLGRHGRADHGFKEPVLVRCGAACCVPGQTRNSDLRRDRT